MKMTLIAATLLGFTSIIVNPTGVSAKDCEAGKFDGAYAGELLVPQNWNCQERDAFWFTDQGSQIVPYVWFLHLEQPDSSEKFSSPVNMDRYRYLPQKPTDVNPDGLPIGFTRGNAKANKAYGEISRSWLGLTCAACHTGQVEFEGAKFLIDGAPTMGDFQSLFRDLVTAMNATLGNPQKFERFAKAVISDSKARGIGGTSNKALLRFQLKEMIKIRQSWNMRNQGTLESGDYGHGRLDAVGSILNEISASNLGDSSDIAPADAPVNYPHIWDTPQHDRVQWNGVIFNAGLGALRRNIGEVLGVFGHLSSDGASVKTSIDFAGLGKLEALLRRLESPLWSDTSLPPIGKGKLYLTGKQIFADLCADCHEAIERTDPQRHIVANMFPVVKAGTATNDKTVSTDHKMAQNFLIRRSVIGENAKTALLGAIVGAFKESPKVALGALMAGQDQNAVRVIKEAAAEHLSTGEGLRKFFVQVAASLPAKPDPKNPDCFDHGSRPCYKARPLNGIWATAPYLHNGSVRTMRQLLLPSSERQKSFKVGTREYDPGDMGFKDQGTFTFDTSLVGNSNTGHEGSAYGSKKLLDDPTSLEALLEYLKTL